MLNLSTSASASATAAPTLSPTRRLAAAGIIGRHAGRTVTITRTESGTTGTVLPLRTPGASNPPRPTIPPPVAFLTSAKVPADLADMAGWQAADFEVYENLVATTQPLPAEVLDAAWLEATTELCYLEVGTQLYRQVAYDQAAYELAAGGDR